MKAKLALVLALAFLVGGCSPSARAKDWAEKASAGTWTAQYRIEFHQEDGDLSMCVRESRAETLILDIEMPSGTLCLEYGPSKLSVNLDQGQLEWEDFARQPPYYSLTQLSQLLLATGELINAQDWAVGQEYSLKMKDGFPLEVKYGTEWTLYVDEFHWIDSGS